MPLISEGKSNWDIDLAYGKLAEKTLAKLLTSKKIEVKDDREALGTGNIVVEYRYYDKPSGIAITEANYWAFIIGGAERYILIIRTPHLKKLARKYYKMGRVVKGGDYGASDMVQIPLREIFKLQGVDWS